MSAVKISVLTQAITFYSLTALKICNALRIHLYLIKNLIFDNFIQFLYISYLLKGTCKYDINYNGLMWWLF